MLFENTAPFRRGVKESTDVEIDHLLFKQNLHLARLIVIPGSTSHLHITPHPSHFFLVFYHFIFGVCMLSVLWSMLLYQHSIPRNVMLASSIDAAFDWFPNKTNHERFSLDYILHSRRLTLILSCSMNFHLYPHDTQQCAMKIESRKFLSTLSLRQLRIIRVCFLSITHVRDWLEHRDMQIPNR